MRFGILIGMVGRKAGGLESYEHGLVNALAALDRVNDYELFCLDPQAAQVFSSNHANVRCHLLWPGNRWISFPFVVPWASLARRVDVLHATFVRPPLCFVPTVFTVHDLGMFTHPQFYHPALRWRMNRLIHQGIRRSRIVICISHTIRELVREQFHVSEDRLTTVYHGIPARFQPCPPDEAEPVLRRYGVRRPYMLFVGQLREGIKNLSRLAQAFHRYRAAGDPEMQLVLAGRRPFQGRYPAAGLDPTIRRLGLAPHIRELGYVADDDLPALYSMAEMLVFPSLCEGFGFPVLEAMACGTPVVASGIDALKEISGGAAVLVNPTSVEDIAAGMWRVSSDRALRNELQIRGLGRAKEFTWERTAIATLDCYRRSVELADRHPRARAAAAQ